GHARRPARVTALPGTLARGARPAARDPVSGGHLRFAAAEAAARGLLRDEHHRPLGALHGGRRDVGAGRSRALLWLRARVPAPVLDAGGSRVRTLRPGAAGELPGCPGTHVPALPPQRRRVLPRV